VGPRANNANREFARSDVLAAAGKQRQRSRPTAQALLAVPLSIVIGKAIGTAFFCGLICGNADRTRNQPQASQTTPSL